MNSAHKNIAIIGASGGIGCALVNHLAKEQSHVIHAYARSPMTFSYDNVTMRNIDLQCEASIADAAESAGTAGPLDLVIVALGFLHDEHIMPEKSLRELSAEKFEKVFFANTVAPALIAKHFLPRCSRSSRAVFAALSARVGSISDNRLGGWYAYRASKAALNMLIKTASIEIGRSHKNTIVVGLHPGTVASHLSSPFQKNVPEGKLFTPEYSASCLIDVVDQLKGVDSGKVFAWDGSEVPA